LDVDVIHGAACLKLGLQPVQHVSATLFLDTAPDIATGKL